MPIEPYLFFEGRTEEAIDFYKETVGAEVTAMMRYKEQGTPPGLPPGNEEKIMHSAMKIGGTNVLASDGYCSGKPKFDGFSLSYTVDTIEEANRIFAALAEGGQVKLPIGKTFFSPAYGMLNDKFGVGWFVFVPQPM